MPVSDTHWSYLAWPAKTAASPGSLFNLVIPTQIFAQSSNPDGYSGHPAYRAGFTPESCPHLALKSRTPGFTSGKSRIPRSLLGTLMYYFLEFLNQLDQNFRVPFYGSAWQTSPSWMIWAIKGRFCMLPCDQLLENYVNHNMSVKTKGKTQISYILGLQPCDKAAMLGVNTIEFFFPKNLHDNRV